MKYLKLFENENDHIDWEDFDIQEEDDNLDMLLASKLKS